MNQLRDDIQRLAPQLEMAAEAVTLNAIIGAMLGTRDTVLSTPTGKARRAGLPYDSQRLGVFQKLHAALRDYPPMTRQERLRNPSQKRVLAFFEAYFSNFIEGRSLSWMRRKRSFLKARFQTIDLGMRMTF